jgi:hypothetical protein
VGSLPYLNDREDLLSYRTALVSFVLGLLYVVFWLHHTDIALSTVSLFFTFLFVFYLAMAGVLAEAGLVTLDLPINVNMFTVSMVGSANLTPGDLTGLGLTNAFARNWRTFTMIGVSHVAWMRT